MESISTEQYLSLLNHHLEIFWLEELIILEVVLQCGANGVHGLGALKK